MSIIVGTGKNARVRLNTGELQNSKGAAKKAQATETPAVGTVKGKGGKGGKNGGKGAKSDASVTETKVTETPAVETEGSEGNEKQAE